DRLHPKEDAFTVPGSEIPFLERLKPRERLISWVKSRVREPGVLPPDLAKPKGRLEFAIIGCGMASSKVAKALLKAPSTSLAMAMDVSLETLQAFCTRFNVPGTADLNQVLESSNVGAVFLCVPHYLHLPLAVKCAK